MNERYENLIQKYQIAEKEGGKLRILNTVTREDYAFIVAEKANIITYLHNKKALEENRKTFVESIEGIQEITAARSAIRNFRKQVNDAFDAEDYRPIVKPDVDLDALYSKYPVAKAYLDAEDYRMSENFAKSKIGKNAMDRIADGEDYEAVIADMHSEWSKYAMDHALDY